MLTASHTSRKIERLFGEIFLTDYFNTRRLTHGANERRWFHYLFLRAIPLTWSTRAVANTYHVLALQHLDSPSRMTVYPR